MCLQHMHVCPICADYIVPVPRCEAAEEADRASLPPPLALPAPPAPLPLVGGSGGSGGGHSGNNNHHHHRRHRRSSFSDSDETAVESGTESLSSSSAAASVISGRPIRASTATGEQAWQRWAGLVSRIGCPGFQSRNKAGFRLCDDCKADMDEHFRGDAHMPPHRFPIASADGYVVWGLIKAE